MCSRQFEIQMSVQIQILELNQIFIFAVQIVYRVSVKTSFFFVSGMRFQIQVSL